MPDTSSTIIAVILAIIIGIFIGVVLAQAVLPPKTTIVTNCINVTDLVGNGLLNKT